MKIAVISDTHIYSIASMSPRIVQELKAADMIVHAGDFVVLQVLDELSKIGKVTAVKGNMDTMEIRHILPEQQLFIVQNKKIGLIHGWGSPWGIEHKIRTKFDDVDVIIYGHTHRASNEVIDGVLFFNPGSARDSFGILEVGDTVRAEILPSEL